MPQTIDKYKIEVDVIGEKAVRALDKAINNLGTRLAQLGIATFVANAYRMADSMKDLADATGLTAGYVKTFADGLQQAGGQASDADRILTTFYRTMEEMAAGSDGAEQSLRKLGISFDDLRTKSEKDILQKTLKRLAEMDEGAQRTAAGMAVFGKSFAQIDPKVLNQILETSNVELLTAQLNKAAATVQAMEANYRDLQITAIAVINSLVGSTDNLRIDTEALAKVIKLVGVAMAISFSLTLLRTLATITTAFITIRKEILKASGAATIFKAIMSGGIGGPKSPFMAIAGSLIAAGAVYELMSLYDKFSETVDNAAASVAGFNAVASDLDGVPMSAVKKYSDGVKELQKQLQAGKISQDEFNKKVEELGNKTKNKGPAFPDANQFSEQEQEARARAVLSAQRQTKELQNQFNIQSAYNEKLLATIGLDEDRAALARELAGIQQDYDLKRIDYQEKIADELAKGSDTNLKLVEEYVKQFEALDGQQTAAEGLKIKESERLVALKKTSVELEKQLSIIDLALATTKNQIEVDKFLAIAKGEISEADADYQAQRQTLQAESDAEIKRLEEKLKNEINDINKEKIKNDIAAEKARTEAAITGLEERRKAEKESQKSAAAGYKKVYEEIAQSISPAQVAADSLRSVFRNLDNALTDFVTKGKFNFKDFARSILADIALIIARALVMQAVLSILGIFSPSAAASLKSVMGGGITPKARGGSVSPGKAYLVGEQGPELAMFDKPGTIVPNNQLSAQQQPVTVNYNINAVDAASFRSMVARDPQFIYNVTEVGRRSNPSRRLA